MQQYDDLSVKELEAIRHVRNWLIQKGRSPSIRELMNAMAYKSPRSTALIVDRLMESGILRRGSSGDLRLVQDLPDNTASAHTVDVPLIGAVACGTPILAEENVDVKIPVSTRLARPPHRYFLLRAKGDSMDEAGIKDGDMVLVRQQSNARNGDLVVALIDYEATVKEFHASHKAIVLKPRSSNPVHQPIVLSTDFQVQGVVVTSITNV